MEEKEFKKIMIVILVIALLVLAFLILRPIAIAIFLGLILAYLFFPLFTRLKSKIKSSNASAFIIVIGLLVIILIPFIFLTPIITRQLLNAYLSLEKADLTPALRNVFPTFFESPQLAADITAMTTSFTSNIASLFLTVFQKLIFNLPIILLQVAIVLFTFFFALRDQEKLKEYFLSISPFQKEYQKRFYQKFEQVTNSVLYGQIVVGITQGIVAGIGYFIFGVPNALLLTLITMLVGVIPIIGPWLVWMPVDIYLFLTEHTGAAIGLLIYGLLVINWVDALIRPQIISRKAKMNSAIALIGMVGGLYAFGIIGLILGPLILAYLFLVIEFYRERKLESIVLEERKNFKTEGLHLISRKK